MTSHDMESTARALVAGGKGILAADETVPTLTKRFDVEQLVGDPGCLAGGGPGLSEIAHEVYDRAAPVPDVTPSPDRNEFLHEVVLAVEIATKELDIDLR